MARVAKRYSSDAITVTYDQKRCIHAAECLIRLPEVFDNDKVPWVQPKNADAEAIAYVVERCPTGALHYERQDGGADELPPALNVVQVAANGPLYVRGRVRLVTAEGALVLEDTRLALCRCGHTQHKPFCDNTHRLLEFRDAGHVEGNEVAAQEGGELAIIMRANGPLDLLGNFAIVSADAAQAYCGAETSLCRCGDSRQKPFCDGTHMRNRFRA